MLIQALGYSWNNKNKTHKLISYDVVRREKEKTIQVWYKTYLYPIMLSDDPRNQYVINIISPSFII